MARPVCFLPAVSMSSRTSCPLTTLFADCHPAEPRLLCSQNHELWCQAARPKHRSPLWVLPQPPPFLPQARAQRPHPRQCSVHTGGPTASEDEESSPLTSVLPYCQHSLLSPREILVSGLQLGLTCVNFVRTRSCWSVTEIYKNPGHPVIFKSKNGLALKSKSNTYPL